MKNSIQVFLLFAVVSFFSGTFAQANVLRYYTGPQAEAYYNASAAHHPDLAPTASKKCENTIIVAAGVAPIGIRDRTINFFNPLYTGSRAPPYRMRGTVFTQCAKITQESTQENKDTYECVVDLGDSTRDPTGKTTQDFNNRTDVKNLLKCFEN